MSNRATWQSTSGFFIVRHTSSPSHKDRAYVYIHVVLVVEQQTELHRLPIFPDAGMSPARGPDDAVDMSLENAAAVSSDTGVSFASHQGDPEPTSGFVKAMTRDTICVVLSHLHPRDGLSPLYVSKEINRVAKQLGDGVWEWWALALWPKRMLAKAVPRLYPTFEALVRDDNRRGE